MSALSTSHKICNFPKMMSTFIASWLNARVLLISFIHDYLFLHIFVSSCNLVITNLHNLFQPHLNNNPTNNLSYGIAQPQLVQKMFLKTEFTYSVPFNVYKFEFNMNSGDHKRFQILFIRQFSIPNCPRCSSSLLYTRLCSWMRKLAQMRHMLVSNLVLLILQTAASYVIITTSFSI